MRDVRDAVAWFKLLKIRWATDIICFAYNERATRTVTCWDVRRAHFNASLGFFVNNVNGRVDALSVARARTIRWSNSQNVLVCMISALDKYEDLERECLQPTEYLSHVKHKELL